MVQQLRLSVRMPASLIGTQFGVPALPLLLSSLLTCLGKSVDDGSSIWAPVSHMGDQNGVLTLPWL